MRHSGKKSRLSKSLELLESRTLLSTTPQVMGYIVDFKMSNTANAVFSEDDSGKIVHDSLDWAGLNEVNYFAILPNATPAFNSASPASNPTSDGGIQPLSDSGFDPNVQLPALVQDAKNHNAKVYVTVGGGDAAAIYDMTALINSPSKFSTFATNIKNFCTKFGLAGVDLDWEPSSATTTQIQNFGNLIQTLNNTDTSLKITSDTLGDPIAITGGGSAFMLNSTAIQNLDAINVEAYPVGSKTESDMVMQNWAAYVGASLTPKLQYGLDIASDDTSNKPAGVIEGKVDLTVTKGYGGLFVFELDSDTANPSVISRIHSEIVKDTTTTGGSVSGVVKNQKGTGVGGITIFLDVSSAAADSGAHTVTAADGSYTFANVTAGSYIIRQKLPTGDTQTSPASNAGIKVTVTSGGKLTDENFTDNVSTPAGGSISGSVKSAAGAGLFGVTVYLDANGNSKLDTGELSAITAADGSYSFTKVPARGYAVRQILLTGDTQKTPASNAGISVTITNGGNLTGKNFADNLPAGATISGTVKNNKGAGIASAVVYLDANNNSKQDPAEHSAITNSSGAYSFANIPAGTYNIRQKSVPVGDTQTTPASGAGIHITPTKTSKLSNENFIDTISATGPVELTGKLIGSTNALSHAKSGHPASNAIDNKTSTTFEDAMASGNWVGLDLGKAFSIKQIKFAADPANPSFMEGGLFQAATKADFSDEVNLYQVPNTSTPSTSLKTITVSNTKTFRYVRYLAPANSFGEVAEIEFFG